MRLSPDELIFWQHGFMKLNGTIAFTWALMFVLVVGSKLVTRKLSMDLERSRWQNLLEIVVVGIEKQIEDVGLRQPEKYIGFLGTLFLFVALATLCTIIPGFEPPTASLSTTAALASVCVRGCAVFLASGARVSAAISNPMPNRRSSCFRSTSSANYPARSLSLSACSAT